MTQTHYQKEAQHERQIAEMYRNKGMYVQRSAGSHGIFDLIAFDDQDLFLILSRSRPWSNTDINKHLQRIKKEVKLPTNSIVIFIEKCEGRNIVLTYRYGTF